MSHWWVVSGRALGTFIGLEKVEKSVQVLEFALKLELVTFN